MDIHKNVVSVTIEGLPPGILLHNPAGMQKVSGTAAKRIPSPDEEAAVAAYWTDDSKSLALPSRCIRSGIGQACSGWKLPANKKLMLSPIVAGDVSIEPDMIPFGTKVYKVDVQRAVVQRQGVLRARPLLNPWRLTFDVRWESQHLGDKEFSETLLPELLARLGSTIGLGDYRPARKGPYGRFRVVEIVAKNGGRK